MVITPAENPSRSCQSTNSGVAAVGSIITAVTGQAASQTARRSRTVAVITPPADPMYEESRTSTNGANLASVRLDSYNGCMETSTRPAPLPQPAAEDIRLEVVMGAL